MSAAPILLAADALALAYAGMTSLCLAMERHHAQVWGRHAARRAVPALRAAGWLLLALAIVPCVGAWGAAAGVVLWLGCLSAGALLLAGLLPYWPRCAVALAFALVLLASVGTGLFCQVESRICTGMMAGPS